MKKEDFVTTFVMMTVSVLMLVSVTIAWYTVSFAMPSAVGAKMEAEVVGDIKIALTPGGEDLAILQGNADPYDEDVVIGLEELINIEDGKMAPGAFGEVTFYITSLKPSITSCQVVPSLVPGFETGLTTDEQEKIAELAQSHIVFFKDEAMTNPISDEEGHQKTVNLTWNTETDSGNEETVTLYWKWYYEYPFTEEERTNLSKEVQEEIIRNYDLEDTRIGTNLQNMRFHFEFLVQ